MNIYKKLTIALITTMTFSSISFAGTLRIDVATETAKDIRHLSK